LIYDLYSILFINISVKGIKFLSTKGIKRLSSARRKSISLPEQTKDILIGILLGDAHIVQRSLTGNSRLVYAQTSVKHKAYFDHVFSYFRLFCAEDYIPQNRIIKDKRSNKTYYATSFTTMQLPCFNTFKDLFYSSGVKVVPINIAELLTPISLAF
jgi:hypothetical protein